MANLDVAEHTASLTDLVGRDAQALSANLAALRHRLSPPSAQKTLRTFTSGEAATLIGITDAYLRQLELGGETPEAAKTTAGRRAYTLAQINDIRRHLGRSPKGRPVRSDAHGT